jgi:TolB-like protein/Flp pilus assembly protein TadD
VNEAPTGFLARLKQRKLVQWALAYVAFAFALLQGVDIVAQRFGWPDRIEKLLIVALAIGIVITLVLAWYHGERGAQKVSGTEIVILALLLAIGGALLWRFGSLQPSADGSRATAAAQQDRRSAPANARIDPVPAKSVAVLPLLNESGDPKQDYFSDGLSEELISALGQVRALKVIGRNSSFQFRGRAQDDTAGIGAKLGVATLLEGTVRKQGDEVRIFASLIKASDGSQLWSQTYERQLKDVFAVQSDIATSVANALKANVFGGAIAATDKPPGGNMAAYDAMLQGRYYADRRTRADYLKAVAYYEQAVRLDPDYALAYARLAIAEQWFNDWEASTEERKIASAQARGNARKAVELAPDSALSLGALGINQAWSDFDYAAAEPTLKKAVALDPSNAETLYQLADVTASLGRTQQAIAMMRKALTLEPLNASFHFYTGTFLLALGKYAEAQRETERALQLQPGADGFSSQLAFALIGQGQTGRAITAANADPNDGDRLQALAIIWYARGDKPKAQKALDEMIRGVGKIAPGLIAEVYAYRGDLDQAFAWLDRAVQARDPTAATIYEAPMDLAALRADPRFAEFCRKAGLPTPAEVAAHRVASATFPAAASTQ